VGAVRYDGTEESLPAIEEWLGEDNLSLVWEPYARQLYVRTVVGGRMRLALAPGEWLARDQDGVLLRLNDDDLAEDYEREGDVDEQ